MYLVTGGAGFIGSNIVEALVTSGAAVRVLDNLANGKRENLAAFGDRVEWIEGDIRDPSVCQHAVRGASVVLHLAALGSVPRSIADPATSNDVNVTGTLNVLIAARDAGVKRVVFSSSSSVYGENPALPKREDLATLPISPYAVSKLAAESYTRVFSKVYGLETVSLRYFNVFGPRQRADSPYAAVIPLFMQSALDGRPLPINGDGLQSRDFTYVTNVVRANLLAATVPGVAGGTYNIACGERYSLLDIVDALAEAAGRSLTRDHRPPRAGDVRHSQADISAAASDLGYHVEVGFREGLALTWRAFLAAQGSALAS
ncbi:MAG TPA: SDR family oxidoreductase [Candidatus Binatia bacterium]|nr:SDR family oxidoreductase [Candidatus Binatia bacterium]